MLNDSISIIILPLPYFLMKFQKSLLETLIILLREKSARNAINISFEKSSCSLSENWKTSRHRLDRCDTRVFFLRHQKSSCIFVGFGNLFIAQSSEKFHSWSGKFLKLFTLIASSDDLEIDTKL